MLENTMNIQANGSEQGDLVALLAKARAENDALKAKLASRSTLTPKVSEKGALSIYGMGRFPVTLYIGQWDRLVKALPAIQEFVEAHRSEFVTKD